MTEHWLAIETVPPGEAVLVYSRRWGPIIAEFSPELGEWRSRMQCPVSLKAEEDELTHWRPLPPPADETAESMLVYRARIVAH